MRGNHTHHGDGHRSLISVFLPSILKHQISLFTIKSGSNVLVSAHSTCIPIASYANSLYHNNVNTESTNSREQHRWTAGGLCPLIQQSPSCANGIPTSWFLEIGLSPHSAPVGSRPSEQHLHFRGLHARDISDCYKFRKVAIGAAEG